jgi:hypothetical protein
MHATPTGKEIAKPLISKEIRFLALKLLSKYHPRGQMDLGAAEQ